MRFEIEKRNFSTPNLHSATPLRVLPSVLLSSGLGIEAPRDCLQVILVLVVIEAVRSWSSSRDHVFQSSYLTFFNLPRPATATATATATTTATASRLRSQKLHIVLWGLHVGLVL